MMCTEYNDNQRNHQIGNFIRKLSKQFLNDCDLTVASSQLIDIYSNNFRHSYSQITNTIMAIDSDELEILSTNIEKFKTNIIPQKTYSEIRPSLYKLYDHIVLEIIRLNMLNRPHDEELTRINEAQTRIENVLQHTQKTDKKIRKLKKEAGNVKTEFVAILGIFAAIILAFAGEISFNVKILESLGAVPIYKAIIIILLCGLILYNGIFGMMHIIAKMIGRDISHVCVIDGTRMNNCDECTKNCNLARRMLNKYPYTYYLNFLLLGLLFLTTIAWMIDFGTLVIYIQSKFRELVKYHPIKTIIGICIAFIIGWIGHLVHLWLTKKCMSHNEN